MEIPSSREGVVDDRGWCRTAGVIATEEEVEDPPESNESGNISEPDSGNTGDSCSGVMLGGEGSEKGVSSEVVLSVGVDASDQLLDEDVDGIASTQIGTTGTLNFLAFF
jgi:hypothetical protein